MPGYTVSTDATSATVGVDLFANQVFARAPQNRAITSVGVAGSAAIGDAEIDLLVDEIRIGNYFNTRTGVAMPNFDDIKQLENLSVPGGAQLRAVVRDAATTNPLNISITVEDA